jgi:3D (Asp-Asp-Asp) domain-containing protein
LLALALLLILVTPAQIGDAAPMTLINKPTISSEVSRSERILTMEATAYCYTGHKTKTGTWPKQGRTIAVDPKVIPYGTKLIINGVSGYVAEDTGILIRNDRIDLYMDSKLDCIKWGRRIVEVRISE